MCGRIVLVHDSVVIVGVDVVDVVDVVLVNVVVVGEVVSAHVASVVVDAVELVVAVVVDGRVETREPLLLIQAVHVCDTQTAGVEEIARHEIGVL